MTGTTARRILCAAALGIVLASAPAIWARAQMGGSSGGTAGALIGGCGGMTAGGMMGRGMMGGGDRPNQQWRQ